MLLIVVARCCSLWLVVVCCSLVWLVVSSCSLLLFGVVLLLFWCCSLFVGVDRCLLMSCLVWFNVVCRLLCLLFVVCCCLLLIVVAC